MAMMGYLYLVVVLIQIFFANGENTIEEGIPGMSVM